MQNNIFLIGPMGAGKTTIGSSLAKKTHRQFFDSDQVIEEHTGARISLIFDIEGEAGFRARESATIDELTSLSDIVLATGGGAVLAEENRRCLTDRGTVIYLQAPLKSLLRRTSRTRNRPLLQTADPEQTLRDLMAEREPLYCSTADLIIDTGNRTVPAIVKEILKAIAPT